VWDVVSSITSNVAESGVMAVIVRQTPSIAIDPPIFLSSKNLSALIVILRPWSDLSIFSTFPMISMMPVNILFG